MQKILSLALIAALVLLQLASARRVLTEAEQQARDANAADSQLSQGVLEAVAEESPEAARAKRDLNKAASSFSFQNRIDEPADDKAETRKNKPHTDKPAAARDDEEEPSSTVASKISHKHKKIMREMIMREESDEPEQSEMPKRPVPAKSKKERVEKQARDADDDEQEAEPEKRVAAKATGKKLTSPSKTVKKPVDKQMRDADESADGQEAEPEKRIVGKKLKANRDTNEDEDEQEAERRAVVVAKKTAVRVPARPAVAPVRVSHSNVRVRVRAEEQAADEENEEPDRRATVIARKTSVKVPVRPVSHTDSQLRVRDGDEDSSSRNLEKRSVEASIKEPAIKDVLDGLCQTVTGSVHARYYVPYPSDTSRYVQCNPWGSHELLHCDKDLIFDAWLFKCSTPANIRNVSESVWSQLQEAVTARAPFNCTHVALQCQNEGVCTLNNATAEYQCVCSPSFSGEFCEIQTDFSIIYQEIMNKTFSLDMYEKLVASDNDSMNLDASYYERYREEIGKEAYEVLLTYLAHSNGSLRYDFLVTYLVSDILKDLYPDAYYLYQFNAGSQYVASLTRMLPDLLSYARFSQERYEQVLAEFQRCLDKLVELLRRERPGLPKLAGDYAHLVNQLMNVSFSEMNQTASNDLLAAMPDTNQAVSLAELGKGVRGGFNNTLTETLRLIAAIGEFQKAAGAELAKGSDALYKMRLEDCKIAGAKQVIDIFQEISHNSVQIWESLVNYGFWHITNALSTI